MTATALFHEIESLPEDLRQEVALFIAFLRFKKLGPLPPDEDFSEAEWAEIDAEIEGIEAGKIASVSEADVFAAIQNRHAQPANSI